MQKGRIGGQPMKCRTEFNIRGLETITYVDALRQTDVMIACHGRMHHDWAYISDQHQHNFTVRVGRRGLRRQHHAAAKVAGPRHAECSHACCWTCCMRSVGGSFQRGLFARGLLGESVLRGHPMLCVVVSTKFHVVVSLSSPPLNATSEQAMQPMDQRDKQTNLND